MFYKKFLSLSAAALLSVVPPAQAMSIEDAYKAIPKQQITYDPTTSPLGEGHRSYLNAFFSLIDMAVAVRVEMLDKMYHEAQYDYAYYRDNYHFVINEISSLQTPYDLYDTQRLTLEALRAQWQFFEQWHYADKSMKHSYKNYGDHPDVQASSRKLIAAYNVFMRQYKEETVHNKKAFYTHLCALDFL